MQSTRSLVWLAAYPRSGNTWLRALLANYFFESDDPVPVNELFRLSFSDVERAGYEDLAGGNLQRLPLPGMMKLRHAYLGRIAAGAETSFVRTHFAHIGMAGTWFIPAPLTKCAVYVVRNPLDMVVSYADYFGISQATAASNIVAPKNEIGPSRTFLPQLLGNWSDHVKSWTRTKDFRVLTLRYEDLLADAENALERVLRHVGAPVDPDAVAQAVFFSGFDMLAGQEMETGFMERSQSQERFFRQGRAGEGREMLAPEVIDRIIRDHGAMMKRFNYL